jgi:hypothetical protein
MGPELMKVTNYSWVIRPLVDLRTIIGHGIIPYIIIIYIIIKEVSRAGGTELHFSSRSTFIALHFYSTPRGFADLSANPLMDGRGVNLIFAFAPVFTSSLMTYPIRVARFFLVKHTELYLVQHTKT